MLVSATHYGLVEKDCCVHYRICGHFYFYDTIQMYQIFAISAGASIGSLTRWQLGIWLSRTGHLAWGTLAANALGGYGIGLSVAWLDNAPHLDPLWRLTLITGLFGALTTFSSFSAEVVKLIQGQRLAVALAWTLVQVITSISLTIAGLVTVQSLERHDDSEIVQSMPHQSPSL